MDRPDSSKFLCASDVLCEFFQILPERMAMQKLVLWGPNMVSLVGMPDIFDPWYFEIVKACGPAYGPVTFQPWKGHPDRAMVSSTAHECAAMAMGAIWISIFPDAALGNEPASPPEAFIKKIDDLIESRRESISPRWAEIVEQCNAQEWMRIVAMMRLERARLHDVKPNGADYCVAPPDVRLGQVVFQLNDDAAEYLKVLSDHYGERLSDREAVAASQILTAGYGERPRLTQLRESMPEGVQAWLDCSNSGTKFRRPE